MTDEEHDVLVEAGANALTMAAVLSGLVNRLMQTGALATEEVRFIYDTLLTELENADEPGPLHGEVLRLARKRLEQHLAALLRPPSNS